MPPWLPDIPFGFPSTSLFLPAQCPLLLFISYMLIFPKAQSPIHFFSSYVLSRSLIQTYGFNRTNSPVTLTCSHLAQNSLLTPHLNFQLDSPQTKPLSPQFCPSLPYQMSVITTHQLSKSENQKVSWTPLSSLDAINKEALSILLPKYVFLI